MIRCSECQKNAVPMTKYMHWLKLCNFVEFLFEEQYIEQTTHDDLQDSLQTMKNWAFENCEDWEQEKKEVEDGKTNNRRELSRDRF